MACLAALGRGQVAVHQGMTDGDETMLKVHVGPLKAAQLAEPHAGLERDQDHGVDQGFLVVG